VEVEAVMADVHNQVDLLYVVKVLLEELVVLIQVMLEVVVAVELVL
tara:strand:+ start:219 stop:356 length:138 start_codon:yes stop_codon:yes gene_type:complete